MTVGADMVQPSPHHTFMKAILEFNLPEDQEALQDAQKGSDWKWAVGELLDHLRNEIRHVEHTPEEHEILEKVRSRMFEILGDRELVIY